MNTDAAIEMLSEVVADSREYASRTLLLCCEYPAMARNVAVRMHSWGSQDVVETGISRAIATATARKISELTGLDLSVYHRRSIEANLSEIADREFAERLQYGTDGTAGGFWCIREEDAHAPVTTIPVSQYLAEKQQND